MNKLNRVLKSVCYSGIPFLLLILFAITGGCSQSDENTSDKPLAVMVSDSGSFPVRGFHIDLRIQVMTPEALNKFAAELAGFGINTLVMEWEATFPYSKHSTISNKYAYTREEISLFIKYCNSLGIDVIPLQQCFGHVEYILRNDRYSHLKEDRKDISQLCPLKTKADSLLFSDLFSDLASLHNSEYIHIGGDETYLLGHCPECAGKAAKDGKSKLFVDYMKMICEIIVGMGKKPVMWADIILKYPEAAAELPKETVFIDWNYGWNTNYFGDISSLQAKGLTFWGAPSLRSHPDNSYLYCWEKHFNNQRDFIPYARNAGYKGIIMTSWSTSGLYGFTWDIGWEVTDMHAIRNVYPLSGSRMLLASYAKAINQKAPLIPEEFVTEYARSRFGLTLKEGEELWKILKAFPFVITEGKVAGAISVIALRDSIRGVVKLMDGLKPHSNIGEFDHLRLMLDLREQYLSFKTVEAEYNSGNFSTRDKSLLLRETERLVKRSVLLDRRFSGLNKGFLYESEIRDQNFIRNQKLNILYLRLKGGRE